MAIENIMGPEPHVRLFVLRLFVLLTFHSAFGQEAPFTGFDDYVNKALRDWESDGFLTPKTVALNSSRVVSAVVKRRIGNERGSFNQIWPTALGT